MKKIIAMFIIFMSLLSGIVLVSRSSPFMKNFASSNNKTVDTYLDSNNRAVKSNIYFNSTFKKCEHEIASLNSFEHESKSFLESIKNFTIPQRSFLWQNFTDFDIKHDYESINQNIPTVLEEGNPEFKDLYLNLENFVQIFVKLIEPDDLNATNFEGFSKEIFIKIRKSVILTQNHMLEVFYKYFSFSDFLIDIRKFYDTNEVMDLYKFRKTMKKLLIQNLMHKTSQKYNKFMCKWIQNPGDVQYLSNAIKNSGDLKFNVDRVKEAMMPPRDWMEDMKPMKMFLKKIKGEVRKHGEVGKYGELLKSLAIYKKIYASLSLVERYIKRLLPNSLNPQPPILDLINNSSMFLFSFKNDKTEYIRSDDEFFNKLNNFVQALSYLNNFKNDALCFWIREIEQKSGILPPEINLYNTLFPPLSTEILPYMKNINGFFNILPNNPQNITDPYGFYTFLIARYLINSNLEDKVYEKLMNALCEAHSVSRSEIIDNDKPIHSEDSGLSREFGLINCENYSNTASITSYDSNLISNNFQRNFVQKDICPDYMVIHNFFTNLKKCFVAKNDVEHGVLKKICELKPE